MEITLGQVRHVLTGLGYVLVGAGVMDADEANHGVDLLMTAGGAILAAVGHIGSVLNKKRARG